MRGTVDGYLSEDFLLRVQRAYRAAIAGVSKNAGPVWQPINDRRADVHAALVADDVRALRIIFSNPASTDLLYGVDDLCRSITGQTNNFIDAAFASPRAAIAKTKSKQIAAFISDLDRSAIIEIGPGLGRTAYYAFQAGLTDYTTVDLPLGIVAQACFLARTIGPEHIWFEGENNRNSECCIKLLSRPPQRFFAVALNVDSLTEMQPQVAINYVLWLRRHVKIFISANRRKNLFTVAQIFSFTGAGHIFEEHPSDMGPDYDEQIYQMNSRSPFWLRARIFALRAFISVRTRRRTLFSSRRSS